MSDRRRFLQVLSAGSLGLVVACGDEDTGQSEASGVHSGGNVSALSVGTLKAVSGAPIALGRDAAGVYAMSTICTHEQCDISKNGSIAASGLKCGCHGATFDANGNATGGPANSPLKHFKVTISSTGDITIDAGATVAADVRVAVAS